MQWFSTQGNFKPPACTRAHIAISGDIFILCVFVCVYVCVHATGIWWVDAAAKHPTMHRIATQNNEFSCPKYQ